MWWRKKKREVSPASFESKEDLDRQLAEAWSRLRTKHKEMQVKHGLLWNRTHYLDLQNFFLDRHNELKNAFPEKYGELEDQLAIEETARVNGEKKVPSTSGEGSSRDSNSIEIRARCWRDLLVLYCRIHARLKVEWRAWSDDELKEFETTLARLRKASSSSLSAAS